MYETLATSKEAARRAGALARLARVQRKQQDPDAALRTYVRLAEVSEKVSVDGIPATLVARAGRASVLEASNRTSELRGEADALQQDLIRGRWPLSRSDTEDHSAQVRQWLGTAPPEDRDALARAEAVEWLWQNRSVVATSRRVVTTTHGPALVEWSGDTDCLVAIVAGPAYLGSLRSNATPAGLELLLSDTEGRPFLGDAPRSPQVAVRTASAAGLPWTLQVSTDPASIGPTSPRRRLLTLVFLVIALVLAAGWYFILRAISRERRVAQLQSDFVAAVSHEFRSPLTSLAHIAEMLARDRFPHDDVRSKSYAVLDRDTERLRRLVEGLLDFGRFEAGAACSCFEPVDIAELVESDGRGLSGPGAARWLCDRAEPARPSRVFVHADREALSRALWNLLDNAVKYSPRVPHGLGRDWRAKPDSVTVDGPRSGARDPRYRSSATSSTGSFAAPNPRPCASKARASVSRWSARSSGRMAGKSASPASRAREPLHHGAARGREGRMKRILVVEDEPGIAFALEADLRTKATTSRVATTATRPRMRVAKSSFDLDSARRDAAGQGRLRRLPRAAPRGRAHADHPADRQGAGGGESDGPGTRRRRLRDQAVQPAGAAGAHQGACSARAAPDDA